MVILVYVVEYTSSLDGSMNVEPLYPCDHIVNHHKHDLVISNTFSFTYVFGRMMSGQFLAAPLTETKIEVP